jgi:hypothetical protein
MDFCTIVEFREALQHPNTRFATLKVAGVDVDTFRHTRHFVECSVYIGNTVAIIYAPITPQAMAYARRAESALIGATEAEALTPYKVLNNELILSNKRTCSLVVEYPCNGIALSEAIYTLLRPKLINGMKILREELAKNNISHNNLHADNIIVADDGTWHCIRQYYASPSSTGDKEALERIEALIERYTLGDQAQATLCDVESSYSTSTFVGGRRAVSEDDLIGFEDNSGRRVIECKYAWASDFVEGRATVTTPDGHWGLIDVMGKEIIEPIYERVDYDHNTGNITVYQKEAWCEFNYNGEQISEWSNRD